MANTTAYSKLESDSRFGSKNDVVELKQEIIAIGSGVGGKSYYTHAEALAIDPLPSDGTIYTLGLKLENGSDNPDAGVYAYDSTNVDGYRFVSDLVQTTDVIEDSSKVLESRAMIPFESVIVQETQPGNKYLDFELKGQYSADGGNVFVSANWISASIDVFDIGSTLKIEGFGSHASIIDGTIPRVVFYNSNTVINSTTYIDSVVDSGNPDMEFTVPSGTALIVVNLAGGSGVGSNPAESPYNYSFKIYEEDVDIEVVKINTDKITDPINSSQILTMETNIEELNAGINSLNSSKMYFSHSYPDDSLGVNGNRFVESSTGQEFLKANNTWQAINQPFDRSFRMPDEWTWTPEKFKRLGNGKYVVDWKGLFNEKVKSHYDSLTKYYVNSATGDNLNDGLTPSTAFKTVPHALTSGARNIILAAGIYGFSEHFGLFTDSNSVTNPLIIRCLDGEAVFVHAQRASQYTFTPNGSAYQTNRTNVVGVLDASYKEDSGAFKYMPLAASLAACQATPGTWFTASGILYIHNVDGRVPDVNNLLQFSSQFTYNSGLNVPYVYFENVTSYFKGSQAMFVRCNATDQHNTSVYLKNVKTFYNYDGNGIAIDNVKESILENCEARGFLRDAFNYHTSKLTSGFQPMKVLEVGCFGNDTGLGTSETSSNGSTTHEGITIIRVSCKFSNSRGSTVADVNDGCMSLNLGVEAYENTLPLDSNFRINGTGSKMWLYDCVGLTDDSSSLSVIANTGSTAYVKNSTIDNGTSGDVVEL